MNKFKPFQSILALAMAFIISAGALLADSPKMGLIEQATSAYCGPCAVTFPGFKEFLDANDDVLIPMVYHTSYGSYDPMYLENPTFHTARAHTYYSMYTIPHFYYNGTAHGNIVNAAAIVDVNALRSQTSPITLTVNERKEGGNIIVDVEVETSAALSNVKLRIAIVEYIVEYAEAPGSNGEKDFYWVARKMLPNHNGATINMNAGGTQSFSETTAIKGGWIEKNMYAVVFIQNDANKEVLQAASSYKQAIAPISIAGSRFLNLDPNNNVEKTLTVENPNDQQYGVSVSIDQSTSVIPTGWSVSLSTDMLIIPPGGSKDVTLTFDLADAAGFAQVIVKTEPVTSDVVTIVSEEFVCCLSSKSKYALFIGTSSGVAFIANPMLNNAIYGAECAAIPIASDVLDAYPMENFDAAFLEFDFDSRGILGGDPAYYGDLPTKLHSSIVTMVDQGKKLFITSEVDGAYSHGTNGSAAARNFYQNILELVYDSTAARTFRQGNTTYINNFTAIGVSGDPIGDGLGFQMNQYNKSTHPYFVYFTDCFTPKPGGAAHSFLFYDNMTHKVGGVRVQQGDAKIVYISCDLKAIANTQHRELLLNKCVDWLFSAGPAPGPEIAVVVDKLQFDEVEVNETRKLSFDIGNDGDENLEITSFLLINNDDGVFTIENVPTGDLVIGHGQEYTLDVSFAPKEQIDYTATLRIISNDPDTPELDIPLLGAGTITGVKDGVYGLEGLFTMKAGPNPFAQKTTITYSIGGNTAKNLELILIDASGREVKRIASGSTAPGEHTVELNSAGLPAGSYFVVARADGFTQHMPLSIIK